MAAGSPCSSVREGGDSGAGPRKLGRCAAITILVGAAAAGNANAARSAAGRIFTRGLPPGSIPQAIAEGPDGNAWFTTSGNRDHPGNEIGRISPAGRIAVFTRGVTDASAIAAGYDGKRVLPRG
ncbi:MAG: hypothetical protein ACYC91_03645 [Solirubrobacteraceae bacterium]